VEDRSPRQRVWHAATRPSWARALNQRDGTWSADIKLDNGAAPAAPTCRQYAVASGWTANPNDPSLRCCGSTTMLGFYATDFNSCNIGTSTIVKYTLGTADGSRATSDCYSCLQVRPNAPSDDCAMRQDGKYEPCLDKQGYAGIIYNYQPQ
jgi:hypothetical protein